MLDYLNNIYTTYHLFVFIFFFWRNEPVQGKKKVNKESLLKQKVFKYQI